MRRIAALLSLLLLSCFLLPTTIFAGNAAGINIGPYYSEFAAAAGAVGPGGFVYVLGCPGNIRDIEGAYAANQEVRLMIRAYYPPGELNSETAVEYANNWALALRALATNNKVYFVPANEVNFDFEDVDPAALETYMTTLLSALGNARGSKVYVLSPSINVYTYADNQGGNQQGLISGLNLNRYDGVALSLYGQYAGGQPDTSAPPIKFGVYQDFVRQFGITKPIYAVETGVMDAGLQRVVYGRDPSNAVDMIADYFSKKGASWGVEAAAIFSYNPDSNTQFGWIYKETKVINLMRAFQSAGSIEPQTYGADAVPDTEFELMKSCANRGAALKPRYIERGDPNKPIFSTETEQLPVNPTAPPQQISGNVDVDATRPQQGQNFLDLTRAASDAYQVVCNLLPTVFKCIDRIEPNTQYIDSIGVGAPQELSPQVTNTQLCYTAPGAEGQPEAEEATSKGLIKNAIDTGIHDLKYASRVGRAMVVPGRGLAKNTPNGAIDLTDPPTLLKNSLIPCDQSFEGKKVPNKPGVFSGQNTYVDDSGQEINIIASIFNFLGSIFGGGSDEDEEEDPYYGEYGAQASIVSESYISNSDVIFSELDEETRARFNVAINNQLGSTDAETNNPYTTAFGDQQTIVTNTDRGFAIAKGRQLVRCSTLPVKAQEQLGMKGSEHCIPSDDIKLLSFGVPGSRTGGNPDNESAVPLWYAINLFEACTVDSMGEQNALSLLDAGWFAAAKYASQNFKTYKHILIQEANRLGLNPAFILATWIEESAASGYNDRSTQALGCGTDEGYGTFPRALLPGMATDPAKVEEHLRWQISCLNTIFEKVRPVSPLADQYRQYLCQFGGIRGKDGSYDCHPSDPYFSRISSGYGRKLEDWYNNKLQVSCGYTRL